MALDLCSTLILTGRSELAVVEEYILSDKKKRTGILNKAR